MKLDLEIDKVKEFQESYVSSKKNLELEKNISKYGVKASVIDKERLASFEYKFNIELPETKMYNQQNSFQCNIYAFLRVIKSLMKEEDKNIDLSANYIEFYDKLEKVNSLYNCLIKKDNLTLEFINEKVDRYIGIYGTFHFCREIVNKYGFVPTEVMKEASSTYNALELIELLRAKVKTDALILLGKDQKEKYSLKNKLIKEAYNLLSKFLGNPPVEFIFKDRKYTPLAFKNNFIHTDLNEFVTVTTFNKKTFFESNEYIPNVYLNNNEVILKFSNEKLKEAIILQLRDGVAVWFSSEESTTLDYDINILDDKLFGYEVDHEVDKNKQLTLNMINYDHAMAITGALVEDNEVKQFKVDNSFGYHGKYKGHLIMSSSFLENKVLTCIIDKKYLN